MGQANSLTLKWTSRERNPSKTSLNSGDFLQDEVLPC